MRRVHDIVRLEPRSTLPSESSGGPGAKSKFLKTLAERGTIMDKQIVKFRITNLLACVHESIALEWQGKEFDSGPLIIELDKNALVTGNQGALDCSSNCARAEFQVRLLFPEFAATLEDLGLEPEFARPCRR